MKIKLILFFVLLLSIVSVVNAEIVYQEVSNYTSYTASCLNPTNFYDSNYLTYSVCDVVNIYCYMYENYTKPYNYLNVSSLQFKVGSQSSGSVFINISVPLGCADYGNDVAFKFESEQVNYEGDGTNQFKLYCYNLTGWNRIYDVSSQKNRYYESGMFFGLSDCSPDWSCNGYDSCMTNDTQNCNSVVDNNTCGFSYSGDYSEFTSQSCSYTIPSSPSFNPVLALFYIIAIMSLGTLFIMYRFTMLQHNKMSMVEFVIECCLIVLGILIVSILLSG